MSTDKIQRIALITGANRGIGRETARQLARRGFRVIIAARDEAKGNAAAEEIRTAGGQAASLPLDVSRSESIRTAAHRFSTIADHFDVLINNAHVYPDQNQTVLTLTRDLIAETFQTNVFGPLEVTQAFLP